jgi:DNA-binding HxlR family transcriptional regulator
VHYTLQDILDQRFRELREAIAAWSKETVAIAKPFVPRKPSESADLNLMLVRTIFSKWSIELLTVLYTLNPIGFEELRKSLRGISSRVLSKKLKMLEDMGLIERGVLNTRPPKVRYAMTEKGSTVSTLGEPVLLYLRFKEGLFLLREPAARPDEIFARTPEG